MNGKPFAARQGYVHDDAAGGGMMRDGRGLGGRRSEDGSDGPGSGRRSEMHRDFEGRQ